MSNELAAVDLWLYETLSGDATLTALGVAGVHDTRIPQDASGYRIVFEAVPTDDVMGVGTSRIMTRAEYKVLASAPAAAEVSFATVNDMAAQIDTLLHGAAITTNDEGTVLTCRRLIPRKGVELTKGGEYQAFAGGIYEIQSQ